AATLLFVSILVLIYRRRLGENYGAMWFLVGLVTLVAALWQDGLRLVARALDAVTLTAPLFLLSILFLTAIAVHFSVKLSENVLDHWVPQLELGFPWFIYYQPLPALVVVLVHRALFGLFDLLTVFNAVRYVLLVGFPLTVFWSLRRMGVAAAGAAMAAAAAPLLSGDFRYGFDYDSYIWRGFGMYTQLAAMHLSFVTVAIAWSSLRSKKRSGIVWLALALAALVLTHLIYAYMMAITLGVIALVGAESRADIPRRLARLALAGVPAALLSAWLWLPFIAQPAFLGASPYLQTEKYDSYGAAAIVGWLVTGDLMDHGRLPVITALMALGV